MTEESITSLMGKYLNYELQRFRDSDLMRDNKMNIIRITFSEIYGASSWNQHADTVVVMVAHLRLEGATCVVDG